MKRRVRGILFLGTIMFMSFLLVLFSVSFVFAESVNGTEWWVLNITNETIDENGVMWGNVSNYTANPKINNTPQFDVLATMEATLWWAEVQLNTTVINFGDVEKENAYLKKYRIKARGTVDIRVTPKLKNENDDFFSNLKFSRIPSDPQKKIGEYNIDFINLSKNNKNWSVVGSSGLRNATNSVGSNGEQSIKLDLTNFEGIIPFDIPRENTIVFQITPLWPSVNVSENDIYHEYLDED